MEWWTLVEASAGLETPQDATEEPTNGSNEYIRKMVRRHMRRGRATEEPIAGRNKRPASIEAQEESLVATSPVRTAARTYGVSR